MATLIMPQDINNSYSQIIKPINSIGGLYLGNYHASNNQYFLRKNKICAVLTLGKQLTPPKFKGILTCWVKIQDNPLQDISSHFSSCNKFIGDNIRIGNVFVHCKAGISRSASIVIAYLMHSKNYSLKKALANIKFKRDIINPNPGFIMQLQTYEESLSNKIMKTKYGFSLQKNKKLNMQDFNLKSKELKGKITKKHSSKQLIKNDKYTMTMQYACIQIKLNNK